MTNETTAELLRLSRKLLDAIDTQDWQAYAELCDATLTAFEPEAQGHLVAGMPFHQFYFELEAPARPGQSTISSPHVRVMGEGAVVCYIRLKQQLDAAGSPYTTVCEETRVWQKQDGRWKHVHFHRSKP